MLCHKWHHHLLGVPMPCSVHFTWWSSASSQSSFQHMLKLITKPCHDSQSERRTDGRTHGQGNYTDSGYDFQQLCKPCSLSTLWVLVHLEHKGGWDGGGDGTHTLRWDTSMILSNHTPVTWCILTAQTSQTWAPLQGRTEAWLSKSLGGMIRLKKKQE